MIIESAVFGRMEISDSQVFRIPSGLFGFEDVQEYALVTKQDDDVTLMWFQAAFGSVPCFVVFDPFEIINGYEPELEPSDLRALNVQSAKELDFLVIAVVPGDISKITVNVKSPIVLNRKERIARQVILRNDYPFKFPLAESEPEDEPVLVNAATR